MTALEFVGRRLRITVILLTDGTLTIVLEPIGFPRVFVI